MRFILLPVALIVMFFSYGCGASDVDRSAANDSLAAPIKAKMPALLIGKWQVDSSGFINDGIQKPMEAPLADSFWEFTKDGKLVISGNVSFTSDCEVVDSAFSVTMMGVENIFRIQSVTEKELVLVSTIMDTKEMKMESISRLKRLN
jgi:hypothetical protein